MTQHQLERRVVLRASPATAFEFFTDSALFADWWGEGSAIDPRPGGAVRICYPGGIVVSGEVLEIEAEQRIVFTYGYEDGRGPVDPGETQVEITLDAHPDGTELRLVHTFADEGVRDAHVGGWRYQLAIFAGAVARHLHRDLDGLLDRFYAAQNIDGIEARAAALAEVTGPGFTFRDSFACLAGATEFAQHLEAARAHGVAATIERSGPTRHCQGTALSEWLAKGADGAVMMSGSNVVELGLDGRIDGVVGLWEPPARG